MYKNCKTPESAMRQYEFEQCLLHTMKHTAYSNISVTYLCAQIGIARKNFYRYFDNKEDVLLALIDHTISRYQKYKFPFPDNSNDLLIELEQYLTFWQDNSTLLEALEKNHLGTLLVERVLTFAWRLDIPILYKEGTIKDPNRVIFVTSGLITLIFTWHHGNYQTPKEELVLRIHRLLSAPIFNLNDSVKLD